MPSRAAVCCTLRTVLAGAREDSPPDRKGCAAQRNAGCAAQRSAAQCLAEAPVLPLQDVWAPDALQRFSVSFLYARIMLVGRCARARP